MVSRFDLSDLVRQIPTALACVSQKQQTAPPMLSVSSQIFFATDYADFHRCPWFVSHCVSQANRRVRIFNSYFSSLTTLHSSRSMRVQLLKSNDP